MAAKSKRDTKQEITLKQLDDVLIKLHDARTKWINLGLALGVDYNTLESICGEGKGKDEDYLRCMLADLLKKRVITWSKLCQGLRKPTVGRNDVAEKIEESIRRTKQSKRPLLKLGRKRPNPPTRYTTDPTASTVPKASSSKSGVCDIYALLRQEATKFPPASRREVLKRIKDLEATPPAKSISILMTGKTGTGKSTLINGILGLKVEERAEEGHGRKLRSTREVTKYQKSKDGIDVTIWDSPGLQDGTPNQLEYLEQMQKQCSKLDFTMYCIKASETRFVRGSDNPDVVAMKKFTTAFGNDFWRNTIIVLTFADTLDAIRVEWEDLSEKEKAIQFDAEIQQWEKEIKEILIVDIKVPRRIVNHIKVVPSGHYRKQHLPGVKYWLTRLWIECVITVGTNETTRALTKINKERFMREFEVTEDDFKKPPEQQPIVVEAAAPALDVGGFLRLRCVVS